MVRTKVSAPKVLCSFLLGLGGANRELRSHLGRALTSAPCPPLPAYVLSPDVQKYNGKRVAHWEKTKPIQRTVAAPTVLHHLHCNT
jgi:hypothetical protein